MMDVLMVASECDPKGWSESSTAYNLAKEINKSHSVTVLSRNDYRHDFDMRRIECPRNDRYPNFMRPLHPAYYGFITKAFFLAKQIIDDYDLVHHVSPINIRFPDPLCNFRKPFIWGPVGGGIHYPHGFQRIEARDRFVQKLRHLDGVRLAIDPFLRNTMAKSSRIVVTSRAAIGGLPERHRCKTVIIPEGIAMPPKAEQTDAVGNYIFASGRLVAYKAMDLLVMAFARTRNRGDTELWITGEGPERERLVGLINELGLRGSVRLLGRVSKEENHKLMSEALFCAFPAIKEAFGLVNLEAMRESKALVVCDWGGPADIVVEGVTGYKVVPDNINAYVTRFAERMGELIANRELRERMGRNGFERVMREYSWDAIGRHYNALYEEVIGEWDRP